MSDEAGMSDGPAPPKVPPLAGLFAAGGLAVLGLALCLATAVLVNGLLLDFSDRFRRILGLIGLAAVAAYVVIRLRWRDRWGEPVLLLLYYYYYYRGQVLISD